MRATLRTLWANRVAICVLTIAGVFTFVISTTTYEAIRFLTNTFNPTTNAADRLWALQSLWADDSVCPYVWGGKGAIKVYDCSRSIPAVTSMAWHVHAIDAWLSIAWIASLAGITGCAIGRLIKNKR